jgi:Sec-independent protein translocase protein TatA
VPHIARQLGRGLREVKQNVAEVDPREDVKRAMDTKPIEAPDDESSAER